jgi:hypothetical protein
MKNPDRGSEIFSVSCKLICAKRVATLVYRIQLHSDNMNMEKAIYRGRVQRGGDFNLLQDLEVTAHGR